MDFGFVSSNEYQMRTEEGRNVTSIDGKRAYLLVVDRTTRYMWTHVTDTKEPPIEATRMILSKFKSNNPHRTVRTDQDSALSRSSEFRKMIETEGFIIEETGTDNSQQNSRAERPHRDLAQMTRCMLHSAGLGPEYWTYALVYATYLKNRIPHKGINKTPFEALTGAKPDLSGCRIFGSRVYARETGNRQRKLDNHSRKGIYLGPTATKKNATYLDEKTGRIKIGSHVIFDEAHTTVPAHKTPIAAEALQRLGYTNVDDAQTDATLTIVKTCPGASTPHRSTAESIGYDICANLTTPVTIQPNSINIIPTGLAMKGPPGTYIRIAPRSGNTIKKNLTTMAGVIDRDYTGEIKVVLFNFGMVEQIIEHGDKIAQAIVEQAVTPEIQVTTSLHKTERGKRGFGSSDEDEMEPTALEPKEKEPPELQITKMESGSEIHLTYELLPYDIELTSVPYDNYTSREIKLQGADPLLGMVLYEGTGVSTQPRVGTIRPSTPAAKLKCWRRDLLGSYVISIENELVKTKQDIIQTIQKFRNQNKNSITIQFATIDKQSIHPQMGLPQLYHDQLNVIAEHLWALKNLPEWSENVKNAIESNSINMSDKTMKRLAINKLAKQKKLTRRILKQQDDWNDWRLSEFKQLDQYQAQGTFGKPEPRPAGANVLDVLWTYLTKDDGTKKARCVCNGAKNRRGTVTLAETYAASLDQTSAKIFWAASAILNFIQIGADATNAFAEAPPPKAPLYVTIDEPYREWYKERFPNEPPIPKGSVLRVHGALQGHPESPRLWATLIDSIIKKLGLKSCKHEPNLYYCSNYNSTGKKVLFLRQVDDFAVSCQDHETAKHIIEAINS
jgi:dUTP pyrophosphatase